MPTITTKHYVRRQDEAQANFREYADKDGKSAAKFRGRTHAVSGLLAGAATGATAGALASKKGNRLVNGALGGLVGAGAGVGAGGSIERKRKSFQTMNSTTRTLVNFSARLDNKLEDAGVINFRDRKDEESGMGKKLAIGAGVAGAAAGGLYLRGRAATGFKGPNPRSVGATMIGGANALKGDARQAMGAVGDLAAKGGAKANAVGRNLKARALIAGRGLKAKMPFGK